MTVPGWLKSVPDEAFFEYKNLTTVIMQENVTAIGDYAFSGCSGLTSLDVSGFNTSKVTSMRLMFNADSVLSSITYGAGFTNSANPDTVDMFKNCPANHPEWME